MLTAALTPAPSAPLVLLLAAVATTLAGPVAFDAGPASCLGDPRTPAGSLPATAFSLDATEVSVGDFETFVADAWRADHHWSAEGLVWRSANPTGAGPAHRRAGRTDDHPVVAVTFFEAQAYCAWRGGRLPTEQEWERAAKSNGCQRYPWGDDADRPAQWYAGDKYGQIHSVNTRPVDDSDPSTDSEQGVHHLAGNVWEWTASLYSTRSDTWRTLRGGSFLNLPSYATAFHREPARPTRVAYTTGFRCAYER
jgi:iron(II)-dependent oxidoreductase